MARDCTTCKNVIFNEQWGEHKCKLKERSVTVSEGRKCEGYVRDKEKSRRKPTP